MVTAAELTELALSTADVEGWDFSNLEIEESPAWTFEAVARTYLEQDHRVLDLGTGGGEVFASLAPNFRDGIGIDQSEERLRVAASSGAENLTFARMSNTDLALRAQAFDVVLAKHADYDADEVFRVLRRGGVFLTQQMGDHDTASIFEAFGWGSFGAYWRRRFEQEGRPFRPTVETGERFRSLGCEVLDYRQFDVPMHFRDLRSLVHFLKSSPLPEPFDPEAHWPAVARLVDEHGSELGIGTNTHRELLVVRKP